MTALLHLYAIGLGSNRPHGRHSRPEAMIAAAVKELGRLGRIAVLSPTIRSAPLGPSRRRFANAAVLLESPLDPSALLIALKTVERALGRRPGLRWGARTMDLDILLWSGGRYDRHTLAIPHPALALRRFVLEPLVTIAPDWRHPGTALAIRHLAYRAAHR